MTHMITGVVSLLCRSKKTIMDFSPEAMARQMTILDNELFQKVDVSMTNAFRSAL